MSNFKSGNFGSTTTHQVIDVSVYIRIEPLLHAVAKSQLLYAVEQHLP